MKIWQLISPKNIKCDELPDESPKQGQVKVKISEVLLTNVDAMIYNGLPEVKFPVVLGRFAMGRIVDMAPDCTEFEKGTRVFLNTILSEKDFKGDSTPLLGMQSTTIAGQTCDGYLRTCVNTESENVFPLPASVSDDDALAIEMIALTEAAIDKLHVEKGQHIVVVGGEILGILLCQLLIYYQAVPILVDSRSARLDFAKKCGIYYTFLNNEELDENINRITGGRFADGAAYITASNTLSPTLAFRLCAPEANIVLCGFTKNNITCNLEYALKKKLNISGVADGSEYISTAINTLANKAVDLSFFEHNYYSNSEIIKVFQEIDEKSNENSIQTLSVINLL